MQREDAGREGASPPRLLDLGNPAGKSVRGFSHPALLPSMPHMLFQFLEEGRS